MELMTDEEFVNLDGMYCPYCRSDNIDGDEFDFDHMSREINCNDCGRMWRELFRLCGYEEEV